jgi:hypothetical protein
MNLTRRKFTAGLAAALTCADGCKVTLAEGQLIIPEQRIALVIGNSKYRGAAALKATENDARAVSAFLRKNSFLVKEQYNLNLADFTKSIADFSRSSAVSDVAVFFYAGHGVQIDDTNYLVPVDADVANFIPELVNDSLVRASWAINADGGQDTIGVVILDACRDNPFYNALRKASAESAPPLDVKPGLAAVQPQERFLVGYSTAANKFAEDGKAADLTPYTKSFLVCAQQEDTTVQQTFERVTTAVCDGTTPGGVPGEPPRNDVECQRPAVYSSLGAAPVYWSARPDGKSRFSDSPILTDIKMADVHDPAVQAVLGIANGEFGFSYIWTPPNAGEKDGSVIPDLDYFQTAKDRARPLIIADDVGYYAPEEGSGGWSLSYPIIDIIARRISPEKVTIDELVVEAQASIMDDAPYATLAAVGTGVAELTIINQSWKTLSETRLTFDVVELREYTDAEIRALIDGRPEGPFRFSITVKDIASSKTISLADLLRPLLPVDYYKFWSSHSIEATSAGVVAKAEGPNGEIGKTVKLPAGFSEWYIRERSKLEALNYPRLLIIGRMVTVADGRTLEADFGARMVIAPPGVGGGTIDYDLSGYIVLPIDGKDHEIRRKVSKTLQKGKETFRGLFPLVAKQSSFHRIRVSLTSTGGQILYRTPWMKTHIIVSKNDKIAAVGSRFSSY